MADVSQIVLKDANGNVIGTYNVKDASVPHDSKAAASGGTTLSLVTTGEKATWNAKSDTDTKVTQSLSSTNAYYPILFSYAGNADKTANVTNICYRNNSVYINPSTGNIRATTFNGYTLAGACAYSATTSVSSGGGALVTSGGVYTALSNKIKRTSSSRTFSAKTTMSNTGLSLTCPSGHIYLVQAWFRYNYSAPRYVAACHSNTTYAFYDCVAASTDTGTTNAGHSSLSFMLTPGETIYYWAMYYEAKSNFISETIVDITL